MKEIQKHDPSKNYNLKENALLVVCDGYIIYQFDEDESKLNVEVRLSDYHVVYSEDNPLEFAMKDL